LLLIVLATTFGGIHCAGWNLPFPTYPEQKLWRIASLALTVIPIGTLPFTLIILIALPIIGIIVGIILSIITLIITIVIFIVNLIIALLCLDFRFNTPKIPSFDKVDEFFKNINQEGEIIISFANCWIYCILAYATARLVLLGLAIALLRHQLPSAFIAVDWTNFYPHIF